MNMHLRYSKNCLPTVVVGDENRGWAGGEVGVVTGSEVS